MKIHFFKSFFLSKLFSVTSLCVENSKLSFWTPSHFKIWPKCYFALLTDAHVGLSHDVQRMVFGRKDQKNSPDLLPSTLIYNWRAEWFFQISWSGRARPAHGRASVRVRQPAMASNNTNLFFDSPSSSELWQQLLLCRRACDAMTVNLEAQVLMAVISENIHLLCKG